MKILTLNTHSLAEPDYEIKLRQFAEVIKQEKPDVFAMQEVNQLQTAKIAETGTDYIRCEGFDGPVRKDNHAYRLNRLLKDAGLNYEWTWIGAKIGYGIYDEGMALFSLSPILDTAQFYISCSHSYTNWKTRKVLGIKTGQTPEWYFTVHMGWWDDAEEPFALQWDNFQAELKCRIPTYEKIWILGDFNSPAEVVGEGYEYVAGYGWQDTWNLAQQKDSGITVGKIIDGWRERLRSDLTEMTGMRIDHIWCNYPANVKYSCVVCNGNNYPIVSDHYGVMIETEC